MCFPTKGPDVTRMNRVSDDAADEHIAHVFYLSHRCRITSERSAASSASFAVAAAPPGSVDCAADSEESFSNIHRGSNLSDFCSS